MKKILITFIIALFIGSIFGYLLFFKMDDNIQNMFFDIKELTLFQTGVFFKEENALNYASSFKNATVIKDGDFYHVYIAVLNNPQSIEKMKKYFTGENIDYYLRKIQVKDSTFTKELSKYESVLLNSQTEDSIDTLNEMILKIYKESM